MFHRQAVTDGTDDLLQLLPGQTLRQHFALMNARTVRALLSALLAFLSGALGGVPFNATGPGQDAAAAQVMR